MPTFSQQSLDRLTTCDERLQRVFAEVIKEFDCTILCGARGEAEQNKAFANGKSNARWPESPHNATPSRAVDAAPYPIDWQAEERFLDLWKIVAAKAAQLGIRVNWGGDFRRIRDLDHFELGE